MAAGGLVLVLGLRNEGESANPVGPMREAPREEPMSALVTPPTSWTDSAYETATDHKSGEERNAHVPRPTNSGGVT